MAESDDLTPQEWNAWLRGLKREWGMTTARATKYLNAIGVFCERAKVRYGTVSDSG